MKLRAMLLITVITVLLCAAPLGVYGQEATPDLGLPDGTTLPTGTISLPPADVVRDAGAALTELIAAFLSGAVVAGASVLVTLRSLVKTVDQNPVLTTAIERLYMSLPADTRAPLREAVTTVKEGVDLVDRLTDGTLPGSEVG